MKAKLAIPSKLRKRFVARRKRVAKQVSGAVESGATMLRKAEKSGALERWKTRVGIGLQAIEVATVAIALVKGRKLAKRRSPAKRTRTRAK